MVRAEWAPRGGGATSAPSRPPPTEPLAVVVSAGLALVTTTASAGSAQAVGPAALLFRSPEELAIQREVPAWMAGKERSEERRGGEGWRYRGSAYHLKKKKRAELKGVVW